MGNQALGSRLLLSFLASPWFCIPALPQWTTVWICPLELREDHGAWMNVVSYHQRNAGGDFPRTFGFLQEESGSCETSVVKVLVATVLLPSKAHPNSASSKTIIASSQGYGSAGWSFCSGLCWPLLCLLVSPWSAGGCLLETSLTHMLSGQLAAGWMMAWLGHMSSLDMVTW